MTVPTQPHVVIVHGYTASPQSHWFPWLAQRLRADGIEVDVLQMPDPLAPEPAAWAAHLQAQVPLITPQTFFVGHSLGCIAVLAHVLAQPPGAIAGGALLVSGFARPLDTLPVLDAFTRTALDAEEAKRRITRIASIVSDNDSIVSPAESAHLAQVLGGEVVTVAGGGHFLDREGFVEFPQVHAALQRLLAS